MDPGKTLGTTIFTSDGVWNTGIVIIVIISSLTGVLGFTQTVGDLRRTQSGRGILRGTEIFGSWALCHHDTTTPLTAESAVVLPSPFVAVTATRRVWPTSPLAGV